MISKMMWHIAFFYMTVMAGMTLGLGCLAAGLYFEFVRNKRKKYTQRDARMAGRQSETA